MLIRRKSEWLLHNPRVVLPYVIGGKHGKTMRKVVKVKHMVKKDMLKDDKI